jgi:hypothetical protein
MIEHTPADEALDVALGAYRVAEPSSALRQRIIACAPRERAGARLWRWIVGAGVGVGLAASGAAGVAAGYVLGQPAASRLVGPSELDAGQVSVPADSIGEAADG